MAILDQMQRFSAPDAPDRGWFSGRGNGKTRFGVTGVPIVKKWLLKPFKWVQNVANQESHFVTIRSIGRRVNAVRNTRTKVTDEWRRHL